MRSWTKAVIWPTAAKEKMFANCDHRRFGPNTMARFTSVIRLWLDWALT